MPVNLIPKYLGPERRSGLDWPRVPVSTLENPRGAFLHIGLVNNMADGAMGATEHQFLTLLESAARDILVHVTLYSLTEVQRKALGQRRVDSFYFDIQHLWEQSAERYPDGLIITGREPVAPDLREEPYWPSFQRVLAWAHEHERSAVWSCLAAHAAVLALDGIERERGRHKRFGIFTCAQSAPHALLTGTPASIRVPHSRWNGVCAEQLEANGYEVLTRTSDGDADTFVKQDAGLFVFFQGHPEYGPETLLGEYRRDIGRYLKGETETYPLLPRDYLDLETEGSLRTIEAKARAARAENLLGDVSAVLNSVRIHNTWRGSAVLIYRNWLEQLSARKRRGSERMLRAGV